MARFALVALVALALLPTALAQAPAQVAYTASVDSPTGLLRAGHAYNVTAVFERQCSNAAGAYDATQARLAYASSSAYVTFEGPGSVLFPAQTCALQGRESVSASLRVIVDRALPTEATKADLVLSLHAPGQAPTTAPGGVQAVFSVQVVSLDDGNVNAARAAAQPAPGPAFALVGLSLLATAFTRRWA